MDTTSASLLDLLHRIREAAAFAGRIPGRIHVIVTCSARSENPETGDVEVYRFSRGTAWALAGPQVATWQWFRRWGTLACGCLRNPFTRRIVVLRGDCSLHCPEFARLLAETGDADHQQEQ